MPHAFAASLQQACGILEYCPAEESHVDMALECVDVPERRIFYTGYGAAIVHQLSDILTAVPHLREPVLGNRAQLDRAIEEPGVDSRVASHPSGESKQILWSAQSAQVQRNPTRLMLAHDDAVYGTLSSLWLLP